MTAHINAIATATPGHDIHAAFADWAGARLPPREAKLFRRMFDRSGIDHRWSVLPRAPTGGSPVATGGFYADAVPPSTGTRMALYAEAAPALALEAIDALDFEPSAITHIVVASCTGFIAPGIDQILAARLGLAASVERLLIGFMGCYAAVTALKAARHIIRSEPASRVLVVCVELSTLHLQSATAIEPLLAMMQFGDGAAAALVSADPTGIALGEGFAVSLPDSTGLISWTVGDEGFVMHLSGEVPGRIAAALGNGDFAAVIGARPESIAHWAVHAGGRSILDAVEQSLGLPADALDASRYVLRERGNMSSATLLFALERLMHDGVEGPGAALAFGPGLAAEGLRFGPTP